MSKNKLTQEGWSGNTTPEQSLKLNVFWQLENNTSSVKYLSVTETLTGTMKARLLTHSVCDVQKQSRLQTHEQN